jgi:hypothetical protein
MLDTIEFPQYEAAVFSTFCESHSPSMSFVLKPCTSLSSSATEGSMMSVALIPESVDI